MQAITGRAATDQGTPFLISMQGAGRSDRSLGPDGRMLERVTAFGQHLTRWADAQPHQQICPRRNGHSR